MANLREVSADTERLFVAEIGNERDGGVSPATLESALDSLQQGYDPRIDYVGPDDNEQWDGDAVESEIESLIEELGGDVELSNWD